MKYRADIDGLRAIAVLTVVGFHAGIPWLKGGFAGVDVFFVISGFLIAGVIAERQEQGDYSLAWFWERRIRRIFPALMVVLTATLAICWALLLPRDFVEFAQSLQAALVSFANVFFWQHSGYFERDSIARPLLHTWSLGVEEQFYFVFPLFMLLAAKVAPTRKRVVLTAVAAASFVLSVVMTPSHGMASFYLPFTRAWELLLGALLALVPMPDVGPRGRHAAGIAGLGLIAATSVLASKETDWPGYAALWPCLGAGLVILGQGGIANRALALRPMVWIGLISYSLYLWHWPLLTVQRMLAPGPWPAALAVLLSVVLAALSLRFVERPFRGDRLLTRRQVYLAGLAAILVIGGVAAAIIAARGVPSRFDATSLKIAHFQEVRSRGTYRQGKCFLSDGNKVETFDRALCATRDPGKPDWLLVGDSHAAAMWQGIAGANPELNIMQATAAGCSLTRGEIGNEPERCKPMARMIYDDLLAEPPDGIILAGRWWEDRVPRVAETLDWARARGIPVVLIGPVPQYSDALPRIIVLGRRVGAPDLPARRLVDWPRRSDEGLRKVAAEKGVPFVSLFDLLCDAKSCRTMIDETTPILWDYGHLTPEGSHWLGARLRAAGAFPQRSSASTQSR